MPDISLHATEILRLLNQNKNVIIVGPPATGKSRLLAEIKTAFSGTAPPVYDNVGDAPFPRTEVQRVEEWMPSHNKTSRNVFEITFHQGTKHRQFVSGITPRLSEVAGFEATAGVMLRANLHANSTDGASLLCIDEINRGPAVAIFGDTLTAIESDKRLGEDNSVVPSASPFYAYGDDGVFREFYLSPHLYILACMNEADTSVEPLDVAFLRRFSLYRLFPDEAIVKSHLRITDETEPPTNEESTSSLYLVLWKTWKEVNRRISLGRSATFAIGHGVLMWKVAPTEIAEARLYASECWRRIEAHVDEVFFGNDLAKGIVYNAGENTTYNLREEYFGDQPVMQLRKDRVVNIYRMLREISLTQGE